MAATRIISIVGRKNAGKTTLAVALVAELARRGRRVMTMKHTHHPVETDRSGSDSWRHFHEGRAERVLLVTPDHRVLFERAAGEADPVALAREYFAGADIVLAEGFKDSVLPKIEVFRPTVAKQPLYRPDGPDASLWAAIVTDDYAFEAGCPVIRFQDTMWLQLLASLAWDRAILVPA
ncbi:MAG TPA: molybdopterin-guanine dinucleotide biosynthesis protein B [Gemmatimonadales bacterium]